MPRPPLAPLQVKADVEKRVSDVLQRTRELEMQVEQARHERRQVCQPTYSLTLSTLPFSIAVALTDLITSLVLQS